MVGTARAGRAAALDARTARHRAPWLLRAFLRRAVALAFALEYPAATRSVVLASGYYFRRRASMFRSWRRRRFPFSAISCATRSRRHRTAAVAAAALLVFSPALVPRYFGSSRRGWRCDRRLRAAAEEAAQPFLPRCGCSDCLPPLEVPAVIVAGAQDRHVDPARHSVELARRVPRSESPYSPRAGHMVHHVDPAARASRDRGRRSLIAVSIRFFSVRN